jgi:hypothetical protein
MRVGIPNSIIGKQQPNVFLRVQKVKEETELVSLQLEAKELGDLGQKRRKTYVKDKRFQYLRNNTVNKMMCTNT